MLIEFLSSLFFIANIFLILLIVMQKNYGGFWSGPSGNDSVMLFGGNQGAGLLQKLTWIFGLLLIFGSLGLSIWEASSSKVSRFYIKEKATDISKKTDGDLENVKNTSDVKQENNELENNITENNSKK